MKNTEIPLLLYETLRIEDELGAGGGGAVYKAWHLRLNKYVVVKEEKGSVFGGFEVRRNEVEALKNVKCCYLPQVFDFLTEGNRAYTVMEYIEGESLDKPLGRGKRFTRAQVIKWYGQLATALETIHSQDICHCDIKPANIMLTPGDNVCLIDFNAALVKNSCSRLISCSRGYASPEQYAFFKSYETTRRAVRSGSAGFKTAGFRAEDSGAAEPCVAGSGAAGVESSGAVESEADTQISIRDCMTEFTEPGGGLPDYGRGSPTQYGFYSTGNGETAGRRCGRGAQSQYGYYSIDNGEIPGRGCGRNAPAQNSIDWKLSDIYSLGATMYHLLTGKPALQPPVSAAGKNESRSYGSVLRIIRQSMETEPSKRIPSASQLSAAIHRLSISAVPNETKPIHILAALTAAAAVSAACCLHKQL